MKKGKDLEQAVGTWLYVTNQELETLDKYGVPSDYSKSIRDTRVSLMDAVTDSWGDGQ